jgi:hypothetical protein
LLSRNSSNIQFIYAYDTHNIGPNRVVLLFITVQSKASVIPSSLIHRNPNTKIHKANFLFKIVYSGYAKRENAAPIKIKHREMQHLSSQMQQHEREWRRSKVLELSSQGHSEREIASTLQMHPSEETSARELKDTYPRKIARTISKMYKRTKPSIKDRMEYCK